MSNVVLTRVLLHSAASGNCGWNREQLAVLGVPWPPPKGWLSALVGCTVSVDVWNRFVALRGAKRKDAPKKKFKTHNALGRPLCHACGHNPRKPDVVQCSRCVRENRPVQSDRIDEQFPKNNLPSRSSGA